MVKKEQEYKLTADKKRMKRITQVKFRTDYEKKVILMARLARTVFPK